VAVQRATVTANRRTKAAIGERLADESPIHLPNTFLPRMLERLRGKIPGLLKLEVGIDYSTTDQSADTVLYSKFESRAVLDSYQAHPEHKAVMTFIGEARCERRLVDYEN